MAEVRVGTSGWSYTEWIGRFYPNGTSAARMLAFYGRRFNTVEAHSTYRRLPTDTTLKKWQEELPGDFRVVPKAHMGITHRRDLDGIEARVSTFADSVAPLAGRLGPTFFSLPHQEPDLDRLDRLLAAVSSSALAASTDALSADALSTGASSTNRPVAAFELGPRWHTPEVLDRLEAARSTLVAVDDDAHDGFAAPIVGPFAYVRLRKTRYNRAGLEAWSERLAKVRAEGRDVFAFFKHDDFANGPRWARRLAALLGTDSRSAPTRGIAQGVGVEVPTDQDREWVKADLGRPPQGQYGIAVRKALGRPAVICNAPLLDDGTPMPTRWWLVDADLRRIISTLEAEGGVKAAEAAVDPQELASAHARYEKERDRHLPTGHTGPSPAGGVGGTRRGVKCLHAHYAWFLAGGDDPVGSWVHDRLGATSPTASGGRLT